MPKQKTGQSTSPKRLTLRSAERRLQYLEIVLLWCAILPVTRQRFRGELAGWMSGLVGGGTNLAAGLQLATKFKELNAVVVVTDGHPNSDIEALKAAEPLKKRSIEILCIGTDDADRTFLARLATRSDLAIHVHSHDLRKSIGAASSLLLRGGK